MNESGRIECVAGLLFGHPCCRELTKLVVDQRQNRCGGNGVATCGCIKELSDVRHDVRSLHELRTATTGMIRIEAACCQGYQTSVLNRKFGV